MSSRSFIAPLGVLAAVVASCAAPGPTVPTMCTVDAECATGEICFPFEGCGNPGKGVVIEVQSSASAAQLPQDFDLGDAGLSATVDLTLKPTTTLLGEFQRNLTASGIEPVVYADQVTVKVQGESTLIPGRVRSYQATFAHPEHGVYSLPIGAGAFTVTAEPADPSIPPGLKDLVVESGNTASLTFTFPSSDGTLTMTGRLIKLFQAGTPVFVAMNLQAFDPQTNHPLSQVVPVSSTTGDFVIFIAPEAQKLDSILLVARPRDATALIPSKTFTLTRPYVSVIDRPLELGDYGDSLPNVKGTLTTTTGFPVAGASVYLSGPVNGGGIFTSKVVVTQSDGSFSVDLLASATNGSYTLTALPVPGSSAGVLQTPVKVVAKPGVVTTITSVVTDSSTVICPDKIAVSGTVVTPDSKVAINVTVIAHAVQQLKELGDLPLPMGDSETLTDESGRYSLLLDPGIYRIDYVPFAELPRTSRVVTVRNQLPADGGMATGIVDLPEFVLSKSRNVSGLISLPPNQNTGVSAPAARATVRYFHVTTIEGRPSSLLLGEALTDEKGSYTVLLPAH